MLGLFFRADAGCFNAHCTHFKLKHSTLALCTFKAALSKAGMLRKRWLVNSLSNI